MELVMVEREYAEPLSKEAAEALVQRGNPCFQLRRVEHVATYLSKDGRRALCAYRAPDAAAVRVALDEEGQSYVRVWSAYELKR